MRGYRLLLNLVVLLCITGMVPRFASAQDTVVVQTLTTDSIGRAGYFHFPEADGTTYEKILMQYTMRCHHGIVSTGNSPEQGCGQWDYNCETFITDSTRTDSIKATSPSASISGWSSGNFPYTNTPTYTLTIRHDSIIGYDGTTGAALTQAKDGTGATALNSPLGT